MYEMQQLSGILFEFVLSVNKVQGFQWGVEVYPFILTTDVTLVLSLSGIPILIGIFYNLIFKDTSNGEDTS